MKANLITAARLQQVLPVFTASIMKNVITVFQKQKHS